MAEEQPNGADLAVDAFGVKANVKNVRSLNTLATVATLLVASLIAYVVYSHAGDSKQDLKDLAKDIKESNKEVAITIKDSHKELGSILREVSQASREQNCLIASGVQNLPDDKRLTAVELCKRLSR